MTSVRCFARLERLEFADLLDGLTSDQWDAQTLCRGWRVRDVAAHTVAYLAQSRRRLLVNMVRARGNIDRLNAEGLRDYASLLPNQLADLMRRGVEPSGAGALYGGRVALIECLIHQQDVRRPLRQFRAIPEQRLRVALNYARRSPVIAGARHTRGIRLVAADMDWSAGSGAVVYGPAEALLLAMTGRAPAVIDELAGSGVKLLR